MVAELAEVFKVDSALTVVAQLAILYFPLQVLHLYKRYFSSMGTIAMATLHILNARVFPVAAPGYEVSSRASALALAFIQFSKYLHVLQKEKYGPFFLEY